MAEATSKKERVVTLTLTGHEALILKAMVQNAQQENEPIHHANFRANLFHVLTKALEE